MMNDKPHNKQAPFAATVIRKLIECQKVESFVIDIEEPWKAIAEAICVEPKDPAQRTEAFQKAITDLPNAESFCQSVFEVDLKANLHKLKRESDGIPWLYSADEILTTEWPEPVWAIPRILPVGLSILAGPPKVGKSWLSLQIALAISSGGMMFGEKVTQGKVLVLALEDPKIRLQKRMKTQNWPLGLGTEFMPVGKFEDNIGDLRNGGARKIGGLIESKRYRLVVIDTLSRAIRGDQNDAGEMTEWLSPIQAISHEKNCALLLLDHHKKSARGNGVYTVIDAVGDILGSTSKAAMADTLLGLYKERQKKTGKLVISGRDLEEKTFDLNFDSEKGCWLKEGEEDGLNMTERRQEILDAVTLLGRAKLKDISDEIGQPPSNTHNRLQVLVDAERLNRIEEEREVFYEMP
jgi:hypothetical protein